MQDSRQQGRCRSEHKRPTHHWRAVNWERKKRAPLCQKAHWQMPERKCAMFNESQARECDKVNSAKAAKMQPQRAPVVHWLAFHGQRSISFARAARSRQPTPTVFVPRGWPAHHCRSGRRSLQATSPREEQTEAACHLQED